MTTTTATTVTTQPNYTPRGPVTVELNFYEAPKDGSPPYQYSQGPPPGQPDSNYDKPTVHVELTDIRGQEDHYTLDQHAFLCLQNVLSSTPYKTFLSDDKIKEAFYPEVEKLLLDRVEGALKVVIFNHVVRMENGKNATQQKPLCTVHADQTASAAANDVRTHVSDPEEAEALLQGRYRIINVWRPLNGVVQSYPLAFASGSSVEPEDLIPIDLRFPTHRSQSVGVRFNPGQEWMYWSGVEGDECLLLKCNDSRTDVPAVQVPHSAFVDPRSPVGAKGRESIEVRALVFG